MAAARLPLRGVDPAASAWSVGPGSARDLDLDDELLAGRPVLECLSLPLGTSLGPLSGFYMAQAEWQSQLCMTHPSSALFSGLPMARANLARPPCRCQAWGAPLPLASRTRGSTLLFNAGPRQAYLGGEVCVRRCSSLSRSQPAGAKWRLLEWG